jgi:hypothetical protein
LSAREEEELIDTLAKSKDIFAWTASDLQGVSRDIIEHALARHQPEHEAKEAMVEENVG